MYTIKYTGEFKRQMKMCEHRGYDMELLRDAIRILFTEGKLPENIPSTAIIFAEFRGTE